MVLFPRKTKFKKYRKFKSSFNKVENRYFLPKVGRYGLKLLGSGRLTLPQLESVRKVCRRRLKKKFKAENPRFSVFSNIPVSKKSSGLRMGKGKGNLDFWTSFSSVGRLLLELSKSINKYTAISVFLLAKPKLPYKSKYILFK